MRRALLLLVAGVAAFGGVAAATATDEPSEGERLLARARAAAHDVAFSGYLVVEWGDAGSEQRQEVRVSSDSRAMEAVPDGRQIVMLTRPWLLDGGGSATPLGVEAPSAGPDVDDKYELRTRPGGQVAGRATTLVEARRRADGEVVERFFVADTDGVLLRRETFDPERGLRRMVAFTRIWSDPDEVPVEAAPRTPDAVAEPQAVGDLPVPRRDPASAGPGFRLVGRWLRADGTAHLYYSDGLLGVSVFQQEGRLEVGDLPEGGTAVGVAGVDGTEYVLATGTLTVFERDGVVFTVVSEAPADDVHGVAADVAIPPDGLLARVSRVLLAPFVW